MAQLVQDIAQSILAATASDAGLQLAGRWINERYVELVSRGRSRQLSHYGTAYVPPPISGNCRIVQGSNTVVYTVGSAFEQAVQYLNSGVQQLRINNSWYWIIGGGFDIQGALNVYTDSPISEPTNNNAPFTIVQRLIGIQADARWISNVAHPRMKRWLRHINSAEMESRYPSRQVVGSPPSVWTEGSRFVNNIHPTDSPSNPIGSIPSTGANLTGLNNPVILTISPYLGTGLSAQGFDLTLSGAGLFGNLVTPIIPWSVTVTYLCNDGVVRSLRDNGVAPIGHFLPTDLTQDGQSAMFAQFGTPYYTGVVNATINYATGEVIFPWDGTLPLLPAMPARGAPVTFTFAYKTTNITPFAYTNQKLIEVYPVSGIAETYHYSYWAIPAQLALTDSLPPEIDAYVLREGVLVDVYRYKCEQMLAAGKIQESEIYTNKQSRQATVWEACIQQAIVADQAFHNEVSVQLDSYSRGGSGGDIETAREWIGSEWTK